MNYFFLHLPYKVLGSIKSFIAIFILLISANDCFSQDELMQVDSLLEIFPDEKVIVFNSNVKYTVALDKKNVPLAVIETSLDKYLALKQNCSAIDRRFYNNYSAITKHHVSGSGQFNPKTSQRCGLYEIDGIFYHDAKSCDFFLNFKKAGEHLNISIEKEFYDLKYFANIKFNKPYAIRSGIVRIEIPLNLDIELVEMNLEGFDINKSVSINEENNLKIIEYSLKNIPSSLDLENLPGYSCSFPHLLVLCKAYEQDGQRIKLLENTDDLYEWYKSLRSDAQISEELAKITEEITKDSESDTSSIAAVYQWIQEKIRYLAFHNGYAAFVPDIPDNVYNNKYGDCKGMANICKGMLLHLGYDARLCWVYSGNNCFSRDLPSISADNHMICAVKLNDKFIYLDPTSKYATLFEMNEAIQGKECIIENGDEYIIGQIPDNDYTSNLRLIHNMVQIDDDMLKIDGEINLYGSNRSLIQSFISELPSENKNELIEYFVTDGDNNFHINDLSTTPIDSICQRFDLKYNMEISNRIIDLGGEILMSLDFYNEFRNSNIDTTRKFSYGFNSRTQIIHEISFQIPPQTFIEALPDSLVIRNPKYDISGAYSIEDSLLIYRKDISIKEDILRTEDFEEWNLAMDALSDFYDKMVILKKR